MPSWKGSYRNPNGEYNAWSKGSAKKPPVGNYSPAYKQAESKESAAETGLEKRVQEG